MTEVKFVKKTGTETDKKKHNELQDMVNKASEKMEAYKKARAIPKRDVPDPFTAEEEIDFESWCIEKHGFDVVADKPRGVRAIFALKDENVDTLLNRLNEWKSAKKIMAKLCHPDTGGNALAMSMLNDFDSLMKSLQGIKNVIEYEKTTEHLRAEYKRLKQ